MLLFMLFYDLKSIEVLEQSQDVMKTKLENNKGNIKIMTQTENEINIRWC